MGPFGPHRIRSRWMRPGHWILSATFVLLCVRCNGVANLAFTGPGEGRGPDLLDPGPGDEEMREQDPDLLRCRQPLLSPRRGGGGAGPHIFPAHPSPTGPHLRHALPAVHGSAPLPRAAAESAADQLRIRGQPQLQRRQLHALHEMGRRDRRGVRANPASVIDCAASGNSPTCLKTGAKSFVVAGVPRDGVTRPRSTRYADFFTASVAAGRVWPTRPRTSSTSTLTSPNFVFRDEVSDRRHAGSWCRRSGCRTSPTRWPTRRPRRSGCRPAMPAATLG